MNQKVVNFLIKLSRNVLIFATNGRIEHSGHAKNVPILAQAILAQAARDSYVVIRLPRAYSLMKYAHARSCDRSGRGGWREGGDRIRCISLFPLDIGGRLSTSSYV